LSAARRMIRCMSTGTTLQPAEIIHRPDHRFEKPGRGGERLCAHCLRGKGHPAHRGVPPSLNALGSGNRFQFLNLKQTWALVFAPLLEDTDLARPCGRVVVEGAMCFPTRVRRDQGNYRFLVEKVIGDVLTDGGWLTDDDWTRYEFGGLAYHYEPGVEWTRLAFFPSEVPLHVDSQLALA
jgi:hypothetical protein